MRSAKVLLLLVTLLLALGALGAKRGRHPARNRNRQNKRSCPIPGCTRCNNQTSCAVCRPGYALTDDEKCGSCGAHCSACARAGPGNCDSCTRGFTLHRPNEGEHGWCEKCAAHCNTCDRAGPGKCDQCGNRRMLDVRMELHDEVHECIPCGDGCRKCSSEAGCTKCDWFYVLHSNGTCTFGWGRIVVGILVVILFCYGCCMLLPPDDFDAPERPMGGPPRRRDEARVLKGQEERELRRRGGSATSTNNAAAGLSEVPSSSTEYLRGYDGIEIIENTSGARDD